MPAVPADEGVDQDRAQDRGHQRPGPRRVAFAIRRFGTTRRPLPQPKPRC